jgi:DNA-dependent RNA polymerase auxiliary subunit epsilon
MGKKMKFDVLNCIETDRGLIVSLDVDEEGRQYLMERGFNAVLIDVVKQMENSHERETPEGI